MTVSASPNGPMRCLPQGRNENEQKARGLQPRDCETKRQGFADTVRLSEGGWTAYWRADSAYCTANRLLKRVAHLVIRPFFGDLLSVFKSNNQAIKKTRH